VIPRCDKSYAHRGATPWTQETTNTKKTGVDEAKPLKVVYRQIDDPKPDPANPRRHSKKQIRQIKNSIKTFGFIVPVLVDRNGNVIAGHGRVLAARELGMAEVPTLCIAHLTPAQVEPS
jgi:ParB-like nuclease domain